ncbi:hypothetical protein I7I51_05345 [Histoplasma capsulatum]|uniref:Uncharacterized protein n=1 Tax=Ajellomyces capsulatus TaxID=5037 RepID=A0A8A1M4K0_AJECA|nr:hypothetical protein I7I51_05345 [Histoplasma capsulatum]
MKEVDPVIVFELSKEVSNLCEYRLNNEQQRLFTNWLQQKYFNEGRTKKCISSVKLILDGLISYNKNGENGENSKNPHATLRKASSSLLNIVRKYVTWDDDGTIHLKTYDPAYYSMQSEPTLAGALIPQFPQGYGQSVNPSVEGDVYPNPGYGQSVNPSAEGDVYPIAFCQLTEADLQYLNGEFMVENSSPVTRLAQTV